MPEKKIDFPWIIAGDEPIVFTELETIDCPRCNYRIPVNSEYTDYRILYEKSREVCNHIVDEYEKLLKELSEINIDVKIDLELRRKKLEDMFKECFRKFGKEYGEI